MKVTMSVEKGGKTKTLTAEFKQGDVDLDELMSKFKKELILHIIGK